MLVVRATKKLLDRWINIHAGRPGFELQRGLTVRTERGCPDRHDGCEREDGRCVAVAGVRVYDHSPPTRHGG
jgi:hypothetical protein